MSTKKRQTKVVVTIGPASESVEMIERLVMAGMDIARVNFSHASHEEAAMRIERIRAAAAKFGRDIKVMQDLQGPRIRIGTLENGQRELKDGEEVTFYTLDAPEPQPNEILIKDPYLHHDVREGGQFLLDSGKFRGVITAIDPIRQRVAVKIEKGGTLLSNKGINVPGAKLTTSSPTEKDRQDIEFGLTHGFDIVAMSFAQTAEEVERLRGYLAADQELWCKIEDPIGVANIDEIIPVCDAVIVARGDLGVEMPMEDIPFIQKLLVRKCNDADLPVVVATQMAVSMLENPTPTRAEVSDIANAVLDGADGVWLSEESTIGKYPVQAVETLVRVASRAEVGAPGDDASALLAHTA